MSGHLQLIMSSLLVAYAIAKNTLVVLLIVFICTARANAIQCSEIDLDESFDAAPQVVVGQFQAAQLVSGSTSTYNLVFAVVDVMKGTGLENVELNLDQERYLNPDAYTPGTEYVMFLETGQTELHICEQIVPLEDIANRWYLAWKGGEASALAQALACVKRSPDTYQSVGGSPLRLGAAYARAPGSERKAWLVSIPEMRPTTFPHGLDLFVDIETGECTPAPMD